MSEKRVSRIVKTRGHRWGAINIEKKIEKCPTPSTQKVGHISSQ